MRLPRPEICCGAPHVLPRERSITRVVGKACELLLDVSPSLSRQTRGRRIALCRSAVTPGAIPYQRVIGLGCKRGGDEDPYCQCHHFYGDGGHRENSMSIRPFNAVNQ